MDSLSRFTYVKFCTSTSAENMVKALVEWIANWVLHNQMILIMDRGSHFCNELLQSLGNELNFKHHTTVAYCAWCNGVIEVLNSKTLGYLRALVSERGLGTLDWDLIVPHMQHALNSSRMIRRKNLSPSEIFLTVRHEVTLLESAPLQAYLGDAKVGFV